MEHHRQAVLKLDFIIVGGGIAGLASAHALASSGHRVRVFEKSSTGTSSVGGGFRFTPNGVRVLQQWGLSEELERRSSFLQATDFIDMETGENIGLLSWQEEVLHEVGAPLLLIRHQDLHEMLYDLAFSSGVDITSNANVMSISPPLNYKGKYTPSSSSPTTGYDPSCPSVTLATGEVYQADIIIGADGAGSIMREIVDEDVSTKPAPSSRTSTVFYTGTIPVERMRVDEHLKELIEIRSVIWMGDGRQAMSYPVQNDTAWNFALWQDEELDDEAPQGWSTVISPSILDRSAFEPRIRAILDRIPKLVRIKSSTKTHAESWVDASERLILIGEAAHPLTPNGLPVPTLPLEDAHVLGTLFSHLRHPSQIPALLYAYQELRQERAMSLHTLELSNLAVLRLPPGPKRDARNKTWECAKKAAIKQQEARNRLRQEGSQGSGDGGDDESELTLRAQFQEIFEVWGYDARDAAEDWWVQWGVLGERALDMTQENGWQAAESGLGAMFANGHRMEGVVDG